jgi:ribonuclease HII
MSPSRTPLIFPAASEGWVIGVDEAGRGCLAGPVTAGAVCLRAPLADLADSKALTPARRAALVPGIQATSTWAVAHASPQEIDTLNILQATFLAMRRAVDEVIAQLPAGVTGEIWVDGNRLPPGLPEGWAGRTFIKGDGSHAPIAAASILAKETRDAHMVAQDAVYPGYGFRQHMSYGTAAHLAALDRLGPCAIHRQTFSPVRLAAERWAQRQKTVVS